MNREQSHTLRFGDGATITVQSSSQFDALEEARAAYRKRFGADPPLPVTFLNFVPVVRESPVNQSAGEVRP